MKSLTVWRGHSTRPSLPAGTAKKDNGSLPHGRRDRLITQTKKEIQEVPAGELPGVHIVLVCGLWQGASGWAHPVFVLSVNFLLHLFQSHNVNHIVHKADDTCNRDKPVAFDRAEDGRGSAHRCTCRSLWSCSGLCPISALLAWKGTIGS